MASSTDVPPKGDRIAKLLARAGIASRREVERMIDEGRIARDGVAIDTPATILTSLAGITVDGRPVREPEAARLFLYHKPPGLLVTERDPAGRPTIYDRLPADLPRLVPVGRLDLNTEGLLLLTTDGGLKRQLELPATGVERTYRARAYGEITQAQLEALIDGIEIEGVRYGSIDANLERRTGANVWIEMTLSEGKNREVRNVLEYLGLQVSRLIRTRYGPFVLGELAAGEVGEAQDADIAAFRKNPKALPQAKSTESRPERPTDFTRRVRPVARPGAVEPEGRRRAPPAPAAASAPKSARSGETGRRTQRSASFKAAHGGDDTSAPSGRRDRARAPAAQRDRGEPLDTRAPRADARAAHGGTLRPARPSGDKPRGAGGPPRGGNASGPPRGGSVSGPPRGGKPGGRSPKPGRR